MSDPANVLAAVLLSAAAWVLRRRLGGRAPASFLAATWAVLAWGCLAVTPDVDVWPPALLFILLCVAAFGVGALWAGTPAGPGTPADAVPVRAAAWAVAGGAACGMAAAAVLMVAAGRGLSPAAIPAIAEHYTTERYVAFASEPLAYRALLVPHYAAALVGGMLFAAASAPGLRAAALLPFAPAVLITLLLTTKSSLIFVAVMWFSGFLATGGERAPLRALLRPALALAALAPVILVLTQIWRGRFSRLADAWVVLAGFRLDFFGFLGPFSAWFRRYWITEGSEPALGAFTLPGPAEALGFKTRVIGVYSESVLIAHGHPSNLYTAFRGLVDDFTPAGAVALLLVLGWVLHRAYRAARRGRLAALPVVAGSYAAALISPIVFFFGWNSILAAWLLATLFLLAAERRAA